MGGLQEATQDYSSEVARATTEKGNGGRGSSALHEWPTNRIKDGKDLGRLQVKLIQKGELAFNTLTTTAQTYPGGEGATLDSRENWRVNIIFPRKTRLGVSTVAVS